MKTEYQKMLAGELYDAGDSALVQMRVKARELLHSYNHIVHDQGERTGCAATTIGKNWAAI